MVKSNAPGALGGLMIEVFHIGAYVKTFIISFAQYITDTIYSY